MPIYKVDGAKKDGLQKYNVRINYISHTEGKAKQLTRTAYGFDAAKTLERKLLSEANEHWEQTRKKMIVQQLFDEYISTKMFEIRESSLDKCKRNFKDYILPTMGEIRIDKLSNSLLQEWKLSLDKRGYALSTKRNAYGDFRAMLNYAVKMEYIAKNPILMIGNFRDCMSLEISEMNIYTAQQFSHFINAAKTLAEEKQTKQNNLSEWDYYVFFNLAFYTGLRKGEIYALRWSDIDGAFLSVKRSIRQKLNGKDIETPPKNKSSIRTIQMPMKLVRILAEHKARQELLTHFNEDFRICGGETVIKDSTVDRRNQTYAELAGEKRIKIHEFRHTHASLLANEGINIQEVSRRLGHARVEMTWNRYSHMYPREQEKAVDILDKIA